VDTNSGVWGGGGLRGFKTNNKSRTGIAKKKKKKSNQAWSKVTFQTKPRYVKEEIMLKKKKPTFDASK